MIIMPLLYTYSIIDECNFCFGKLTAMQILFDLDDIFKATIIAIPKLPYYKTTYYRLLLTADPDVIVSHCYHPVTGCQCDRLLGCPCRDCIL